MKTIFKYPLSIITHQEILMPEGAEIIHVGIDPQNSVCAWALVDSDKPKKRVPIKIYGTGHEVISDVRDHLVYGMSFAVERCTP